MTQVFDITKITLPSPTEAWVTLGQLLPLRPCGLQTRESVGAEPTPDQVQLTKSLQEGFLSSEFIHISIDGFKPENISGELIGEYYNHTRLTFLFRLLAEKKISPDYLVQVRIYPGPLSKEQKLALYQRAKTALAPTQKNSAQHEIRDAWRIFNQNPSAYLIDKRGSSRLAVAAGISERGGSHNRRDAAYAICRACAMLDLTPDVLFSLGAYQQQRYLGKNDKGADKWLQTAAYIHSVLDAISTGSTKEAATIAVKKCFGTAELAAPAKVEKPRVDLATAAKNTANAMDRMTLNELASGALPTRTTEQNILLDAIARATTQELAAMLAACTSAAARLFPTVETQSQPKPEHKATTHKATAHK